MSDSTAPVVLCLDGDHTTLWVRSLLLSVAGYRVFPATTGDGALQLFRLNPVDLVIIDLWRLDSPRPELVAEIKRINPTVPVILLTALVDLPLGFEQADLILTECITPPEFLAAISSVVAKTRQAGAEDEF